MATEAGFDKAGIARAEPLAAESPRLAEWLLRGYHGEMGWIEREPEKRTDPRLIFPEARSVLVVALNYFTPHEHGDAAGKISRYAWGDDYHDVVREKLRHLLELIKGEVPEADGKICVDTAPVMDKAWAVRAGIGWQGKHTNVITPEFGSWFFIGEILLNLDLEPDGSLVPDHCGTCTACLDACPTGAITEPYVVDSNKCISYATIELRTEQLPVDVADSLEGWLYGCDICQDVCPWNRFEKPTAEPRFEPRKGETSIAPEVVISLTPESYAERFRRSAIKRAKLPMLKRNAKYLKTTRPEE
ncbi:MAG: tRNA epoxyqueuosine(34) reductase QueG [Pyrinomonadaceae bacterium]|nr:tRNA epoxyqueuosine(34) reductase QueG [Pyrinomonadaceae bacterium]